MSRIMSSASPQKSLRAILAKHSFTPKIWYVFPGVSEVPLRAGVIGHMEQQAAKAVTALSKRGELGTYIATWAVKGS
ncbi:MAG: hypothetical protein WKF84_12440 [Pyrinomonadaceae bacterium]